MRVHQNEVGVVHYMDNDKTKGIDFVIAGDWWTCGCGANIIGGFGRMIYGYDIGDINAQNEYLKRYTYVCEIKR